MRCSNLGPKFPLAQNSVQKKEVYACKVHKFCTLTDCGLKSNGVPLKFCEGEGRCLDFTEKKQVPMPNRFPTINVKTPVHRTIILNKDRPAFQPRPEQQHAIPDQKIAFQLPYPQSERLAGRFCYVTGSNRPTEPELMVNMIHSARMSRVPEDFHCFAVGNVPNATSTITTGFNLDHYMFKFDLLKEVKNLGYDYYVWVDPDNYFVRDPGDLANLLRDEPIWVAMEGDLTSPLCKHKTWWGIPVNKSREFYRGLGAKIEQDGPVWNTNAGMFIVRHDAVDELASKTRWIYNKMCDAGYRKVTEEPPLSCVGHVMVKDYQKNTFDNYKDIWGCDWSKSWGRIGMPPDGRSWDIRDWATGQSLGLVNPAIVHLMSSKQVMRQQLGTFVHTVLEPVGSRLEDIFLECQIVKPVGCSCNSWIKQMNEWGVVGCEKHRGSIVHHLNVEAEKYNWYDTARIYNTAAVVLKGYLNTGMLLDEAIKRARLETTERQFQ